MNKKYIYPFLSFLFLTISLLTIEYYNYLNNEQPIIIVSIIISFVLFCTFIIFISRDVKNIKYFALLYFIISLFLVRGLIPSYLFHPIFCLLISFSPYFIYKFFISFNLIAISSTSKRINFLLFIQSAIVGIFLLINFEKFAWMIFMLFIIDILSCLFMYKKERDRLTLVIRKEQSFFALMLVLSLCSVLISSSLLSGVLILLMPVTVSIILIKRNDIRLNKTSITVNLITHLFTLSILITSSIYFLHFSMFEASFIIVFYCLILYIFHLKNRYLNSIELKKIKHTKHEYQKERLDLIQTITKEKTLSSISSLISKILLQNYEISSHLVVWKDMYHPYILSCKGEFLDITLTSKTISEFEENSKVFHYQNCAFKKFTFYKNHHILGWLIVSKEKNTNLTPIEYESINELTAVIGEIILENEKLYDIKQEAFKLESFTYDEYVNYEYLNMVQNFHKDFSFFIHDNVLQNILALKKLTESIDTEHIETKKLILETFDNLNEVFRDKIFELYPSTIEKTPLSQSVQILCDKLNAQHNNIAINFYCLQKIQLKKEETFHIYRIIQELVINALKHSQAEKIYVSLVQNEFYIEIIIQDNGIGFNYSEIKLKEFVNKHFGLLSITQEVNSLNGKMKILPVKPHGTKFTITLPIEREEGNS